MKQASNLKSIPKLAHGFFGRAGGNSTGIFASLNCGPGSGDNPLFVSANRAQVAEAVLPGATLVTLKQVHSPRVVTVTEPWEMGLGPEADGMVTSKHNIILGILTADCAPVLFADRTAGVIGAAHAGWKGAAGGVLEATITAMERMGADTGRISAAIGPCICQNNYEVGAEFEANLTAIDADNRRFFIGAARPQHFHFDLEGYVAHRLRRAGLFDVSRLSTCTYAAEGDFFSFRRSTHRKESDYGRQISAIALAP